MIAWYSRAKSSLRRCTISSRVIFSCSVKKSVFIFFPHQAARASPVGRFHKNLAQVNRTATRNVPMLKLAQCQLSPAAVAAFRGGMLPRNIAAGETDEEAGETPAPLPPA